MNSASSLADKSSPSLFDSELSLGRLIRGGIVLSLDKFSLIAGALSSLSDFFASTTSDPSPLPWRGRGVVESVINGVVDMGVRLLNKFAFCISILSSYVAEALTKYSSNSSFNAKSVGVSSSSLGNIESSAPTCSVPSVPAGADVVGGDDSIELPSFDNSPK